VSSIRKVKRSLHKVNHFCLVVKNFFPIEFSGCVVRQRTQQADSLSYLPHSPGVTIRLIPKSVGASDGNFPANSSAEADADFIPLHGDPEFEAIVAEVKKRAGKE
jgi:hypothetical protein